MASRKGAKARRGLLRRGSGATLNVVNELKRGDGGDGRFPVERGGVPIGHPIETAAIGETAYRYDGVGDDLAASGSSPAPMAFQRFGLLATSIPPATASGPPM